ncbi:hypothetical protein [Streptomyces sp. NBC_00690]|uniref:hypothetical protein n=1 Tax=Streptomyces sp. NBC_00690 TaxID=2975808 RepID=UPI002E2D8B7A|nr:hypothetical protein [Streptomyces sp. NBC_00690]
MSPWKSLRRTLLLVVIAWAFAGTNTLIAYASLGTTDAIPIFTGVLFGIAFVVALRIVHEAWWLAALSLAPALMVLVGSGDYAPYSALEVRGVHEQVTITADSAAGTTSNRHEFTLVGEDGELKEKLLYRGQSPDYAVGDRIEVVYDPEGAAPLKDASKVDSAGRLTMLVWGTSGWTAMALLAGWRGHVNRRNNREPLLERIGLM